MDDCVESGELFDYIRANGIKGVVFLTSDQHARQEQIVGYVLPFNDILSLMQPADMQSITELSRWWIQKYGHRRGV